jgi:hypothetical protein
MPGTEIVSIVRVFTSVTGTLVGAFFGVQIGSMGREEEREEKAHMEMMAMKAIAALDPLKDEEIMKEMEGNSDIWQLEVSADGYLKYLHQIQW